MNYALSEISAEFKVSFLIEKLKENLEKHLVEYQEAVIEYKKEVENQLVNMKKAVAKSIRELPDNDEKNKKHIHDLSYKLITLKKPVNETKNYKKYIKLFEESSSEILKLSLQEADTLINDEWDWAVAAKTTNSSYTTKR